MGHDIKIQNRCDHEIIKEVAYIEPNRYRIRVRHPIATSKGIVVFVEGNRLPSGTYRLERGHVRVRVPGATGEGEAPRDSVVLDNKIRVPNPLIEVSYKTYKSSCPKCLGSGVVDDITLTPDGDTRVIEEEAYLAQMLEKYIITEEGSNIFHKWVGTSLQSLTGSKILDGEVIKSRILEQVKNAISKLQSVQNKMASSGISQTPGELYGRTIGVDVLTTDDPTLFEIRVDFTARSGRQLTFSQYIELETFRQRHG